MKEIITFAIACAVSAAVFFPAAIYVDYNSDTNVAQREMALEIAGDAEEALRYEKIEKAAVIAAAAEKALQQENIAKAAALVAKKDAEKAGISEVRKEIGKPSVPKVRISGGAAYLPDRFSYLMPELHNAIKLVARRHEGCESISNASISENYSSKNTAAYFVSCKMSGKTFPYQNVFVKNGRIIATTP